MSKIWILHREDGERAALARLAGAGEDTLVGSPTDDIFEVATGVRAIVLGLAGDLELELEFAHRVAARLDACT